MLKAFSQILDALERIEKLVIVIFVTLMIILMIYQVVLRYLFSAANSWSEELVRYLFIYTVMLGSAIAARRNSHLQIDVFINVLKNRTKCVFTIAATVCAIVFICFLFMYSISLGQTAMTNMSAGLKIPMAIPYLSIPIGCVLIILTSLEVIFKQARQFRHKCDPDTEVKKP